MVLDYRERKPVNKNRPKSKPVGLFVLAFGAVACCSFALGVLTDRFLLPPRTPKTDTASAPRTPTPEAKAPVPQTTDGRTDIPGQQNPPPSPADPPLTFYKTLPKGGKAILGSGINPKQLDTPGTTPARPSVEPPPRKEQAPSSQADVRPVPKSESTPAPPSPPSKGTTTESAGHQKNTGDAAKEGTAKKVSSSKGKFTVQFSSTKDRKEAEAIKASLQEKGFAAYVVESSVAGKGTWYRVRIGKQLDQTGAGHLATQIGKGAIIVPE